MVDLKSHAENFKQFKASNIIDKAKELQLKEKLSEIKEKYGLTERLKSFRDTKDEKRKNDAKTDKWSDEKEEYKREIKSESNYESKYESQNEVSNKKDSSDNIRSARSLTDGLYNTQNQPIVSFKSEKLNHLWKKMKYSNFTLAQLNELKARFDMQQERIDSYNALLENLDDRGNGISEKNSQFCNRN